MSRQYAVKDRDQTIHPEASRKAAQRDQKAYGGIIMQSKASGHDLTWKPYRRHRVFLWVFLAIQAV